VNNKKFLWGLCAATAIGMAFEAGMVVGENTPPEKNAWYEGQRADGTGPR
jgi:hypothetical protein